MSVKKIMVIRCVESNIKQENHILSQKGTLKKGSLHRTVAKVPPEKVGRDLWDIPYRRGKKLTMPLVEIAVYLLNEKRSEHDSKCV